MLTLVDLKFLSIPEVVVGACGHLRSGGSVSLLCMHLGMYMEPKVKILPFLDYFYVHCHTIHAWHILHAQKFLQVKRDLLGS